MTKVITRCFDSAKQAKSVRHELIHRQGFSQRILHVYDQADGLADLLTGAEVSADTAKAYQKRVAAGGVVLMVRAGHKPLGVAQTTRDITAAMGALDMGGLKEEVVVDDDPMPSRSVLSDHRHILTRPRDPDSTTFHMANWPIPLISRRKPFKESLLEPHARMADFPIPLISHRKPYTESVIPKHGRMANFPLPLISRRKPFSGSAIPKHGRMANFPIPLISRRKPYTGSLIGKHTRMANWPFPHLINGTSNNSLVPEGKRMANFPIPLLSDRKPYDKSMIPRHGRMANLPISLISKRKPFTGSIFPRHARMADFILPLVIKHSEKAPPEKAKRFSISRILGIPTLLPR